MVCHYSDKQILLVGEGDFSFSLSLAKAFGSSTNITAASFDIRGNGLGRNYNNGKANVEELERLGCTVVRGVNIHSMTSDCRLARYDIIIFHFIRAGKHHEVVKSFMESAREMVKDENGEIHVTHKTIYPFNEQDIKALAEETGLRLIKQMKFHNWIFPGNSVDTYSIGSSAVTFMFKK
ncbi:hypothetical protein ISN45_At05g023640 [Arabidopsis thaliana x Arabidopsis arenosa]|uniref:25S rRNA (uridine-N(3))-methyltransferase BMT5-like domain-containing protein n=1 Tax=Arabidopsis thaliana x Arabidopsis arenosa TaxID=1240361 RepID=A0A8T2CY53_9BRAS|nr:hypothetical protein ISN45_At05g023640 [Arabidopsis thaliana x Arabidopsis arenosa]